ncbi:hypothetical protein [Vibrio algivorus]|uniref:Inovirus Gp2 family protein n=1 Tax=Vibrio algivorus TaxID=1667024 RepID=A0A557NSY3_9VIBR|nr:hypothetical protein [Vibrio algivorus]TVO31540.1 hypothetical protein FOF44_17945 [Vibrio algivorus]
MNISAVINHLLSSNLNLHEHTQHHHQGKPLAYPVTLANQSQLDTCFHALEHSIQKHPLRLVFAVILEHPPRNGGCVKNLNHRPHATSLQTPTTEPKIPDKMMQAYFDNINHRLEKYYIPRRNRKFSRMPFHALTKPITEHQTIVVFLFNRSEYKSLGRDTGLSKYLITQLNSAWTDTIDFIDGYMSGLSWWSRVGKQWEVNMKHGSKQSEMDAMRYQLSWLAHPSLGDSPIQYWRY